MLCKGSHGSPLGLFGNRGRGVGPLNQEPTEAPGRSSIACPWKSTSCSRTFFLPPESASTIHVPARLRLTRLRGSTTRRNLLSDRCFRLPTVIPTKCTVLSRVWTKTVLRPTLLFIFKSLINFLQWHNTTTYDQIILKL
jgi:hypothetical protein